MQLLKKIANKLLTRFHQLRYRRAILAIEATAPLTAGELKVIVLSMVQHRDVLPYLVALKSFHRFVPAQRVVVVCDPSITTEDRDQFRKHVPFIELLDATSERHPDVPTGGTWERLLAITRLSPESYVIQLDADTLTLCEPRQVLACIQSNAAFVLAGEASARVVTAAEAHDAAARHMHHERPHIQTLSEFSLTEAAGIGERYVRGCSGFCGFPSSDRLRADLLHFSQEMQRLTGTRWREWGTEQVTSNYLVANSPGVQLLEYPAFATPDESEDGAIFRHYIGWLRFINAKYCAASKMVIAALPTNCTSKSAR